MSLLEIVCKREMVGELTLPCVLWSSEREFVMQWDRGGSTGVAWGGNCHPKKNLATPAATPVGSAKFIFFLFSFCFYKSFTKASFKCPTASECNQEILPHPAKQAARQRDYILEVILINRLSMKKL